MKFGRGVQNPALIAQCIVLIEVLVSIVFQIEGRIKEDEPDF